MLRILPSLRSAAARSALLRNPASKVAGSPIHQQLRSQLCTVTQRPNGLTIGKPLASKTLIMARYQSTKQEEKLQQQTLKPTPETVSESSTILPMVGEAPAKSQEDDTNMMAGIYSDLQTIRDTFSLENVPRQAYYMGLAGVLPYMATSLSTVYCAYEINRATEQGSGLLMTEQTAEILLHIIEPLQVGYGAVIISFLGAIHWGLEWAGYGGNQGYPRYMIGVVSTAIAWPTILFPVEYALITQFLVFNFLYYTDSRATKRGWAPPWYAVYRFVLTFIVGGSIVLSLIGRGQIADRIGKLPGPADRIRQLRDSQEEMPAEEEESRAKFLGDEEEEEGGDDDE